MPIQVSPPSADLQPFAVPGPAYTDPLQTLAQFGQLRAQGLQRQGAELQLQQEQMQMQSMQGLMRAYQEAGGDIDATAKLAPRYGVLPDHVIKMQQTMAEMANKRAQTKLYGSEDEKNKMEAQDREHDLLYQAYDPVWTEKDPAKQQALLQQINQRLTKQGWAPEKLLQYQGPDSVSQAKAAYTTFNNLKAQAEIQAKQAEIEAKKAETTKTGLETQNLEKQQVIAELDVAPKDEKTGGPTPAAVQEIQTRHPKVILPPGPWTTASLEKYRRTGVATEKQPEFDVNTMKAQLGMLGNTEFDQFLVQHARSITDAEHPNGKTPAQLTPAEFKTGLQQYKEYTADPALRALAIGQQGLQQQMTRAQLQSIPDKTDIDLMARQLINGDLAPSELSEFRTRNANAATQVLKRADEMVKAEGNPLFPGRPFSFADLQTAFEKRKKTEIDFDANGEGAKLVRSFGNAIQHTALLDDARKALYQSDIPALKRIAGILGTAVGGTAATTYDLIADFVSDEVAKAFIAGGGGQGERQSKRENFDRGKGDAQISSSIKALMHLLDSQRQGLEEQYARGTSGKGLSIGKLFSPATLAARDRLMGKAPARQPAAGGPAAGGKIIVRAGDGSLHPFDSEAQAKIFEDSVKKAGGTTTRQ